MAVNLSDNKEVWDKWMSITGDTIDRAEKVLIVKDRVRLWFDIYRDEEVSSAWKRYVSLILEKDWIIKPSQEGEDAKRAAVFIEQSFKELGNHSMTVALNSDEAVLTRMSSVDMLYEYLLLAEVLGESVVEILYEDFGSRIGIDRFRLLQPDLFLIKDGKLRLKNDEKKKLTPRKFLYYMYGNTFFDRGDGMLRRLYVLVTLRRTVQIQWSKYAENWGDPKPIIQYEPTKDAKLDKKIVDDYIGMLNSVFGAIVVPSGVDVNFYKAAHTDIHKLMMEYFDRKIRILINGSANTTELSNVGAYSAIQQMSVNEQVQQKASSDRISEFLRQTLLAWMMHPDVAPSNIVGAPVPIIERSFPNLVDYQPVANAIKTASDVTGYYADVDHVETLIPLFKSSGVRINGNTTSNN